MTPTELKAAQTTEILTWDRTHKNTSGVFVLNLSQVEKIEGKLYDSKPPSKRKVEGCIVSLADGSVLDTTEDPEKLRKLVDSIKEAESPKESTQEVAAQRLPDAKKNPLPQS